MAPSRRDFLRTGTRAVAITLGAPPAGGDRKKQSDRSGRQFGTIFNNDINNVLVA